MSHYTMRCHWSGVWSERARVMLSHAPFCTFGELARHVTTKGSPTTHRINTSDTKKARNSLSKHA